MLAASTTFDRYRDRELTLEELVRAASRWLNRLDLRPGDGRVAEDVDARGVRYYQTLGVLDRPVRYDGRRAVYAYRHLLQLLCVKKLQQEGHPLQLIQRALAGRSTEALERALLQNDRGPSSESIRLTPDPTRENGGFEVDEAPASPGSHQRNEAPRLIAVQVARGVTVTVDTSQVPDAGHMIDRIRRLLSTHD